MTGGIEIPVLETERLRLRPPAEGDVEDRVAFRSGPRARSVGGRLHRNEVWRGLAVHLGHWALRGCGMWAVDERATGAFGGNAGPRYPEGWPEPEIGWTLPDRAEGRGIAREAAAARAWACRRLGWRTAIGLIDPANDRSVRLAERLGAQADGGFVHARLGPQYRPMRICRHSGQEAIA